MALAYASSTPATSSSAASIHHVDIGEMDAINLAGPADHIWIDHCEIRCRVQSAPKEHLR